MDRDGFISLRISISCFVWRICLGWT